MPDLRDKIQTALNEFEGKTLKDSALGLLATLGYKSERTLKLGSSKPKAFLEFLHASAGNGAINEAKALVDEWKSVDLLFQLTDNELSGHRALFDEHEVSPSLMKSYVFFAIELIGDNYARGKLTDIARQINRVFPMPVMVLMKHKANKKSVLSIAVINRRANKRDTSKDVLGKVTIIRDITFTETHRGHLDILDSFAKENLNHPQRLPINNFDNLHTAWEEVFNVELLNKRFYKELANWYFWALPKIEFPTDVQDDDEKRRATSLIRLLTRLIFCWFLKEKGLVPDTLFNETDLKSILKELKPDSSSYYHAILQNLFFGTLNQRMGKDNKGSPYRTFAKDEGFHKNKNTYGVDNLLRYEDSFKDASVAIDLFADIPFLNGGLFECLDRTDLKTEKKIYIDGFSRNKKKRPVVPNHLFFGPEQDGIDLSEAYGERSRRNEKVRGLIRILSAYKFTIVENTPIDQEIALDPELLGKVFENLLASYNEETKTTARKQTGSFYTPRPIVEYMVDESLKAYLTTALTESGMAEDAAKEGLEVLFAYTEQPQPFRNEQVDRLLDAIHTCKILDPACGSGAFPMGMLQKLVYIIHKLDPANEKWMQIQIDKASEIPDSSARGAAIKAIEQDFKDNEDDYGRKLYLIENCLYGVDIQPIAIQISKLRFFISLVCDQKTNRSKRDNLGIRPLPNLETKFVAADTLIGLQKDSQLELFESAKIKRLESELRRVRHDHFAATTRQRKLILQARDCEIREELARELEHEAFWDQSTARRLANWNPYDPQASADFFEPLWMFDRSLADGFCIVIGNPPYGATISNDAKAYFNTNYRFQDYQLDTYLLFMERGITLLRAKGIQCLIVPNTWLPSVMLKSIRKMVFSKSQVLSIVDIQDKVFGAVVDNTILTHANCDVGNLSFPVYAYQNTFKLQYVQQQSEWRSEKGMPISLRLSPDRRDLANAIAKFPTLENEFLVTPGCKPYQVGKGKPPQTREIVNLKPFTSEKAKPSFRPLLRGKLIHRFRMLWKDDLWIKFGDWLAEPRHTANYDATIKIVLRQTGDSLIGTLDSKQFVVMNNLFTICPKSKSSQIYFALSAINSSTLNWYYQNVINPERGEALAEVKKNHLVRLPLPRIPEPLNRCFESLVKILLFAGECDAHQIFTFMIDLMDACVMECYFEEHMAKRNLLFLDDVAPHLANYDPKTSKQTQAEFLEHLYRTLNAPESPIRNRLLRLTADSPDLLAVIKTEGKV